MRILRKWKEMGSGLEMTVFSFFFLDTSVALRLHNLKVTNEDDK